MTSKKFSCELKKLSVMTFHPLHRDKKHKFKDGHWTWRPYDDVNAELKFHSHSAIILADKKENPHDADADVGLKFSNYLDEAEEKIFLEIFARPKNSFYDGDVITIQDIKNLALFTSSSKSERHESMTKDFIEFLHTSTFDEFFHATIFYIDHFLLTLEYLLIRRDDGKIKDLLSMRVERFLSKQLSDRRLLMAREYSQILMQKKTASPERDLIFFELLIDFSTQCTFIAMHSRSLNAISCEVNRLFRTEFFNRHAVKCCQYEFTFREQQILFGECWYENSLKNYRQQNSPLMAELLNAKLESEEILKIGKEKYFGTNKYFFHLELNFVTPEVHLHLFGQRRGILGHPKHLYDAMLQLNMSELLRANFSEDFDPYGLIRRVFIEIHTSDEFVERRKNLLTRFIIHREPYGGVKNQKRLWKRKDLILRKNLKKSLNL